MLHGDITLSMETGDLISTHILSLEDKTDIELPVKDVKYLSELELYFFDKRYVADNKGNEYKVKGYNTKKDHFVCNKMNPYVNRDKYIEFVLIDKYGKKKHIQGQRIVAGLYIPKPVGSDYVNHKDGDRQNNHIDNLEWVTHSENIIHSYHVLGSKRR